MANLKFINIDHNKPKLAFSYYTQSVHCSSHREYTDMNACLSAIYDHALMTSCLNV